MPAWQVIVAGAGHAGCEAALASARCGARTLILTLNLDTIAHMPCNPSIGGQGKGQLVREIDALGGEMGKAADRTHIQARLLNTRKGLAVQAIRVQSDKPSYGAYMREALLSCPNLTLQQGLVTELITSGDRVIGVRTASGDTFHAPVIILTPGTFLRGLIHIGSTRFAAGRAGEPSADALGESLIRAGLPVLRFKTGTPPRVAMDSICFDGLECQPDEPLTPSFSLRSQRSSLPRRSCHLTRTTTETRTIIQQHLHESALFSGTIRGTGPRYCPSIEDKIAKFPEKEAHKVFLEPEGAYSREIYLQGLSTSLPEAVQELYVRSLPGLENARITRPGYAVEYDVVTPTSLLPTLMSKHLQGLFLAGQVNGTSGYEEAAGQGLIAGINASALVQGNSQLVLSTKSSYLGLLIEELTTQELSEPYRVFTSRSPNRLSLRMSNAEERLSGTGREVGLLSKEQFSALKARWEHLLAQISGLQNQRVSFHDWQATHPDSPMELFSGTLSLAQLLKRPEISIKDVSPLSQGLLSLDQLGQIEVEARIKYEGYEALQERETTMKKEFENALIPEEFLRNLPTSLSTEAKQKIMAVRPATLGALSRIPGVRATDVALTLMVLRRLPPTEKK